MAAIAVRTAVLGMVTLGMVAPVAEAYPAGPAWAGAGLGSGSFGLRPSSTPAGRPRSYFKLGVAPGETARDKAVLINAGPRTQRLKISISRGVTATNSGSAYQGVPGSCVGAGCWVTGLPGAVTLAPGERRTLPFRVRVPDDAEPAQYLAGITAEPAVPPRAVRVGSNGQASANAVIIRQVTVGVAVTVGALANMKTAVAVSPVSAGWVGRTPRLSIPVRNDGATFARATGSIACGEHGRRRSYNVVMGTVLPGTGAILPINARGLKSGSLPCTVRLRDGNGLVAAWSGTVDLPSRVRKKIIHTGQGVYTELPHKTVPPWAIALMVLGTLILAALLTLLGVHRKQHRRAARSSGPDREAGAGGR